jgi:hypothetical protein
LALIPVPILPDPDLLEGVTEGFALDDAPFCEASVTA